MLFFFGTCCKWGHHLYSSTARSCCIPALCCHLSATLQIMSIIVVNLQDNRAVFWIFITLLRFSFDCPSYVNSSTLSKEPLFYDMYPMKCYNSEHSNMAVQVWSYTETLNSNFYWLSSESLDKHQNITLKYTMTAIDKPLCIHST